MKVFTRLVLVIIFLAVVFGGIFGWKYYQMQQQAARASGPQPAATVSSAEAQQMSWRPTIQAVGSATAVSGIDITTEVAGKIGELGFQSGARVEAGDVLVRLDNSIDQAALTGLRADRQLARVQFERASNLLPKRAVSQSQYDEAKAKYEAAQAKVAEQQARIDKKAIEAPFAGLLGLKQVDVGEYLTPGQTIVTLTDLDPIHVDYSVPEQQFNRLEVGQTVRVTVAAYPERRFEGEITAIDARVEEGTRSVDVRATVPNPEGMLRPGMFAEVATLMPSENQVVTVPRTAISYNTYGDFVYVLNENDDGELIAERRAVTTGKTRNGDVAVVDGLKAGERVVRTGQVKLRDGQPVTIDNSVALNQEITEE